MFVIFVFSVVGKKKKTENDGEKICWWESFYFIYYNNKVSFLSCMLHSLPQQISSTNENEFLRVERKENILHENQIKIKCQMMWEPQKVCLLVLKLGREKNFLKALKYSKQIGKLSPFSFICIKFVPLLNLSSSA